MDNYPLYINGTEKGKMRVYADGLLTCFEAMSEDPGGLVRLSVFGGGKSAYLGTMQKSAGGLYLLKKFSRNEIKRLPTEIEYAANEKIECTEEKTDDTLLWFPASRGCLVSFDGSESYIALPVSNAHLRHAQRILRTINGRSYAVFPGKRNASLSGNPSANVLKSE